MSKYIVEVPTNQRIFTESPGEVLNMDGNIQWRKLFRSETNLRSFSSDHNIYINYVCLVNQVRPTESRVANNINSDPISQSLTVIESEEDESTNQPEPPIQVERSKALHNIDLDKPHSFKDGKNEENDDTILDDNQTFLGVDNPNVLKLTRMKWLTDGDDGGPNSSSHSITPTVSSSSSINSQELVTMNGASDKYLSTIMQLDKEHNMFGLSNIELLPLQQAKKPRKDEKPAFPQTAIVQICCQRGCCRHKSNTDLPSSLKCGGCRSCGVSCYPNCSSCFGCSKICSPAPCRKRCKSPPPPCKKKCCWLQCAPTKCYPECVNDCYGMSITLNKKTKFEPFKVELTPRSSCILQKPLATRSCHHWPKCIPPSSCFPFLMPCYWPSRPSAPCSTPDACFHNPPCLPRRKRQATTKSGALCVNCNDCGTPMPGSTCGKPCADKSGSKCPNQFCPGNIPEFKAAIEKRFGASSRRPSAQPASREPSTQSAKSHSRQSSLAKS